jgi:Domain of unknown function (DUF5666)
MTVNRIAAGSALCCAVLVVAACGGGSESTGSATGTSTTASSAGGAAGGARGFPGTTGLLAQIDGTTLQVQGTDTQTAVTYSAKTTFTRTVAARRSDIVVGVCVQARSAPVASGSGSSTATAAPTAADPIVATSVEISPAVNGSCSAMGGLRMGGTRPSGATGGATAPAGTPNPGRTRGTGAGGNGFGGGASGKVTAVNSAGFTVQSSRSPAGTATTAAPTTQTSQTIQATTGTTYTRTGATKSTALVVGLCVTALGKADSTGSIAATSIALRPAVNGSCSSGFGGRAPGAMPTPTGGGTGA